MFQLNIIDNPLTFTNAQNQTGTVRKWKSIAEIYQEISPPHFYDIFIGNDLSDLTNNV